MKTKFDIGDEIYSVAQYGKEGYWLLGKVEEIALIKYDLEYHCRDLRTGHKVGDLVEVLYFTDTQIGKPQKVEASEVFKTKEEALRATIAIWEAELIKSRKRLAEKEAEIQRLKETL